MYRASQGEWTVYLFKLTTERAFGSHHQAVRHVPLNWAMCELVWLLPARLLPVLCLIIQYLIELYLYRACHTATAMAPLRSSLLATVPVCSNQLGMILHQTSRCKVTASSPWTHCRAGLFINNGSNNCVCEFELHSERNFQPALWLVVDSPWWDTFRNEATNIQSTGRYVSTAHWN